MIASKVFLGLMIVEWKVRFISIKPPNITRSLAHPSVRPLCIESEEADALVEEKARPNPGASSKRQVLPASAQPQSVASSEAQVLQARVERLTALLAAESGGSDVKNVSGV
jgi:hypothetical protein